MAKEETQDPEKKEDNGGGIDKSAMFSKTGLIVFGSTVVLMFVLFAGLIFIIRSPEPEMEELSDKKSEKTSSDLNAPMIKIDKKVVLSIPTTLNATEFRHLALTLNLTIGRLPSENGPDFNLDQELAKEQFLDTAENFKPYARDLIIKLIGSYSYLELQQETTKTEFRQRLKDQVNDKLQEFGMKRRITGVLIQEFIFSD